MGFSEMVEILQQRHKGVIVLCKNGNFYIAVGKDAIALNKKIGLKLTCMGPELCKAGFPVSAFEKYTKLLWDKKCNYMIYDFNNEKEELILKVENYCTYISNVIIKFPKTLRNKYYKNLTYKKLMQAHIKSRKGKNKSI